MAYRRPAFPISLAILLAACTQAQVTPQVTELVNTYINYGAPSPGGAPDCEAWTALFGPNVTTRTPVTQSGTGCMDVSDPAAVCEWATRCYSAMSSKVVGQIMHEDYSASFQRIGFNWQLSATKKAPSATARAVDVMTTFTLALTPNGNNGFKLQITNQWGNDNGASDMFSECMCYC